jgi:hypothetical protein
MVADEHLVGLRRITLMATIELAAGPALFGVGVLVVYFTGHIGPLDRAQVQGFVGLPLMALGPAIAGVAGRVPEVRRWATLVIRATAVAIGVLTAWAVAVSVAFVGCRPVTTLSDALPEASVVGVLAAASYGVAGAVALGASARGRRWLALAQGASTFVIGAALSVAVIELILFPPVICAPPH